MQGVELRGIELERREERYEVEVVFEQHGAPCLLIKSVLSEEERRSIQAALLAARKVEDWEGSNTDHRYRQHARLTCASDRLREELWRRVSPAMGAASELNVTEDTFVEAACTSEGVWKACGLRDHLQASWYGSDDFFAPHRDGFTRVDDETRSFFTVLAYLDHRGDGGRTLFLTDNHPLSRDDDGRYVTSSEHVHHAVDPRPGDVLVFFHKELHAGEILSGPDASKLILLSTVLYRRDPTTVPDMTDDERLGLRLYEEACVAEDNRDWDLAIAKYSRAYRLNRRLADAHGC